MNHPLTYHQMARIHQDEMRHDAEVWRMARQSVGPRGMTGWPATLGLVVMALAAWVLLFA